MQAKSRRRSRNTVDDLRMREKELFSQIKKLIYTTPSPRTFSVMAVVSALTLALPVWLLVSAFAGKQVLLLPLAFVLCLISIAIGCRIYYKKLYITPLRKKQEQILYIYKEELEAKCEETERSQCMALIEKLQSEVSYRIDTISLPADIISLVKPVVQDIIKHFESEARRTIDELFSSVRGQRDYFLGNGIYLQNIDTAYEALGLRLVSSRSANSPVKRVYENIVGIDNKNVVESGSLFTDAETYLLEAFRDQNYSPEQVREQLLLFLADCWDKHPMEKGAELSTGDFMYGINDQELWEEMPQSLALPPLCNLQKKADHAQKVFFCASSIYFPHARFQQTSENIEKIRIHNSAGVEEKSTSVTSPWMLLAGLYTNQSSFPTNQKSPVENDQELS